MAHRLAVHRVLGAILAIEADRELQGLVEGLAARAGAPVALVSLVLDRLQVFRAHHGLPPDLAAARAIDRGASYCATVVDTAQVLVVPDAAGPDRPELLERCALRSYLGAPILVEGEAIGCVALLDRAPRTFDADAHAAVLAAAGQAATRIAQLAAARGAKEASLHDRAVRPQFAELRNRMQPMLDGVQAMQVAVAELQAVLRLVTYVATHPEEAASVLPLENAAEALADLEASLDDVADSAGAVHRAMVALESASLVTGESCAARAIVDAASTLAHHHTKLVGGVRWVTPDPQARIPVPLQVAVKTLAAALSSISGAVHRQRGRGGLDVALACGPEGARFHVAAPDLDPATLAITAAALAGLVVEHPFVTVRDAGAGIELTFAPA